MKNVQIEYKKNDKCFFSMNQFGKKKIIFFFNAWAHKNALMSPEDYICILANSADLDGMWART